MKYTAEKIRDTLWVVRPEGQLGTCGFYPEPWKAVFVTAQSESDALRKADRVRDPRVNCGIFC